MKISVAMATFNGGNFIQEQLDSLLMQVRKPDELVVCDDGSSDKTVAIIESFAKSSPFKVHLYQNENTIGCTGNFNKVLSLCEGDLVFLSDQDDVWFPKKIETVEKFAYAEEDCLLFINDAAITNAKLEEMGFTKLSKHNSLGCSDSSFITGCCVAVKKELLKICLPIPVEYGAHDEWIVKFGVGLKGRLLINTVLQYYRRHETNTSQAISSRTHKVRKIDAYLHRLSVLKNNPVTDTLSKIKKNHLLLQQIEEVQKQYSGILEERLNNFQAVLLYENELHIKRANIRQQQRIKRLAPVFSLLRKNAYSKFNGLKSAVRDILFQ